MSRKQALSEQYIDAFFGEAMADVVRKEGQEAIAINNQLKKDPDAVVPETIRSHCQNTIYRETNRWQGARRWSLFRGIRIASIIVLLLAVTISFTYATLPEAKETMLNMVSKQYDTHTDFSFKPDKSDSIPYELIIDPDWLPNGFHMVENGWNASRSWQSYRNDHAGTFIRIEKQYETTDGQFEEMAEGQQLRVQGFSAKRVEENDAVTITWLNTDFEVIGTVFAQGISADDVIRIAENIR